MEFLLLLSVGPFLLQFLAGLEMSLSSPEGPRGALASLILGSLLAVEVLIVAISVVLGRSSPTFRRASAAFATYALFVAVLRLASIFELLQRGSTDGSLEQILEVGRFGSAGILFWALWATRQRRSVELRNTLPVALGLGIGAVSLALLGMPFADSGDLTLARPWQILPLVVLLACLVPLTGTLSDLSRDRLSSRLSLCLLPEIAAQLHFALGSRATFDHHFSASLLLQLLAESVILLGLARNGVARFHQGAAAVRRLEESLSRSTQDLAESRQLLVAESESRSTAERTLRFLRTAIETTQLGVVVADLDGKILYANPGQGHMHGIEAENLVGQPASLLGPLELRAPSGHKYEHKAAGFQRESINQHKDGSRFPVLLTSDLVRNEEGSPVARVTIAEDIRDRKRNERELLQRGAVLGAISTAAARLLQGRDWETGIEESLALLGATLEVRRVFAFEEDPKDPKGRSLNLRFGWGISRHSSEDHGDLGVVRFQGSAELALLEALRSGEGQWGCVEDFGDRLPVPFQQLAGASILLQPVLVRDRWWGIVGVSDTQPRDWSLAEVEGLRTAAELVGAAVFRKDSERSLRESERRFRNFFESSTDLIQSVRSDGRFSYVNRAWKETLGYSQEEVAELQILDIVAEEHRREFQKTFNRMLAGENFDRIETVFISHHGRHVVVEGSTSTEHSSSQGVSVQGIFRDISQRRRMERMKGEFIAIVSHELRTPLTSIHAALRLLRAKHLEGLSTSGQQLVELAHQNSRRLGRLIDDVIDVERLDSGRLTFHLQTYQLTALISQAVEETRVLADRLGVGLVQRPIVAPFQARLDGGRLVQVLKNLLTNAIKFSPENGLVEVVASRVDGDLRVEVRDQGPGIPREFREKVFERFFQVDPSETRSQDGTGLGLNIAQAIIERLGGKIGFDCPPEGGTVFYFHLPSAGVSTKATPEGSG